MALINSKDCRCETRRAATACLNCGSRNDLTLRNTAAAGNGERWFGMLSLGLLASMVFLVGVPEASANSASAPAETTSTDPVAAPATDKIVAELPAPPAASVTPNPHQKKLLDMSEGARRTLLTKVIQSSGVKCTKVTRTFYQGSDTRENHIWSAACAQGDSFSITLYNDAKGSTGVVDCGVLVAVAGVSCFESLPK